MGGKENIGPFHFFHKIGGLQQFLEKVYSDALRAEYMAQRVFCFLLISPTLQNAKQNSSMGWNVKHKTTFIYRC
jgi:hypothetical protein